MTPALFDLPAGWSLIAGGPDADDAMRLGLRGPHGNIVWFAVPHDTVRGATIHLFLDAAAKASPWRPMATAPKNTLGIAVLARMTCCGGGQGLVTMTAQRASGLWIYPGDHCFDFLGWAPLPPVDAPLPQ